MTSKLAFLNSLTPAERGALLGSILSAGGAGTAAYLYTGDKEKKVRNAALAALAGGALGGGVGYGMFRQPDQTSEYEAKIKRIEDAVSRSNAAMERAANSVNRAISGAAAADKALSGVAK